MGSALLVVDVQNDVVASIPVADEVIATIAGPVDRARAAGSPVVWVQHQDEDLEHGSQGWRIVPELVPAGAIGVPLPEPISPAGCASVASPRSC